MRISDWSSDVCSSDLLARPAGDDRTGVAHAAARRRADARDEADHRLLAATAGIVLPELGGLFFGRAADLADHDDRLVGFVGEEKPPHTDEVGSLNRIAPDAARSDVSNTHSGGLVDRLLGDRVRPSYSPARASGAAVARIEPQL